MFRACYKTLNINCSKQCKLEIDFLTVKVIIIFKNNQISINFLIF